MASAVQARLDCSGRDIEQFGDVGELQVVVVAQRQDDPVIRPEARQSLLDHDPVMRTPMNIDKDKNAIKVDYDVPEGSKFRFSVPPDLDIVTNIVAGANELKGASQEDAEALLIFSCAGRLNAMGPLIKLENEGLAETWNAPMAGFFSYGEYGTTKDRGQEFHSTTCCWVALKEK